MGLHRALSNVARHDVRVAPNAIRTAHPAARFLLTGLFKQWSHVRVVFVFQVFADNMAVKQVDHPIGIIRIRRRVRHHHDGCAFFIQIHQCFHDLIAMGGIQVACGLIC